MRPDLKAQSATVQNYWIVPGGVLVTSFRNNPIMLCGTATPTIGGIQKQERRRLDRVA